MADSNSTDDGTDRKAPHPPGFLIDVGPKSRQCQICGKHKPLEEFYTDGFYRRPGTSNLMRRTFRRCKACTASEIKQWNSENPDRAKASNAKRGRRNNIFSKYGITEHEYNDMLSTQNGCCAICGSDSSKTKKRKSGQGAEPRAFSIDHCHKTGKIRALLCGWCNTLIGLCEENPSVLRAAIEYLNKHGSEESV